jgi:hypothetical protein
VACGVRLIGHVHQVALPVHISPLNEWGDDLVPRFLMALKGQHRVRVLCLNRLRNFLLRPHGVDRHETAGSVQPLESGRASLTLVTLLLDGHLSQNSVRRGGPRTHHMERTSIERTVKTLACGITIDVHHVVGERSHNSLLDLRKTSEKLIRKASGSSGANTLAHVS